MRLTRRYSFTVLFISILTSVITFSIVLHQSTTSTQVKPKGFVGSTGYYRFYDAQQRNRSIGADMRSLCKEAPLTQCNPKPTRPYSQRVQDRTKRKPFKMAMLHRLYFEDPDFTGCDYDNCEFVGAGPEFAENADAVIANAIDLNDKKLLPPLGRTAEQVYIVGSWEVPLFTPATFLVNATSPWNSAFNATITYRLDSDMIFGYGMLDYQPAPRHRLPDYGAIYKNKKKSVIWIVSNCNPHFIQSKRREYVHEMQKYIDIDIFGKCGTPCEVKDEVCIPDFTTTYKFYLAFENSFCLDYVSEKFFKLFIDDTHIIPVVRGAVDYNKQFPAKSFVNAADFKSPKRLARFLNQLGENEDEYRQYLEVKDRYRAITYGNRYCQVCEYLHKNEGRRKTIPDAKDWFSNGKCWSPTDI